MELKQLEFFLAASDCGSLGRAAQRLYTTQPNVSKVIGALERELGSPLFERTSRGLKLTDYGRSVYQYADNILKNADLITHAGRVKRRETFCVSAYPSNMVASILVDLYQEDPDRIIEHRQGTVEELTNHVARGVSELGVLYVSQKQRVAFQHIISHKKLEFIELGTLDACIFVGPNSPLYPRDSVSLEELYRLRFVRGLSDYFSMEHHLKQVNVGAIDSEKLRPAVYTNSEHLLIDLLLRTDLVDLGIDVNPPDTTGGQMYDIKNLRVEGEEANLILGYVIERGHALSDAAKRFLELLKGAINP